ncbi:hypothetical protein LIPSTDRAFT_104502 [Lipomyces starkeyi NRRL Y-11557]|uniref:Uncharacterized protein n=1 Tax=Lipomyces starkeyi NRRL Y-11557 TaxID=675824 RepID=A0A1E3Q589_LIPST|nr:hypothetical protein LIPSTDRAFT_104502 [Lipomyces starkeyi NRRL Y-11557]
MPDTPLPLDYVDFGNPFVASQLTPQNSHIVFERLNCKRTAVNSAGINVRTLLNEAVLPLVNCQNGPDYDTTAVSSNGHVLCIDGAHKKGHCFEPNRQAERYIDHC